MRLTNSLDSMIDETKIFDELKAMVSPLSAYLDNLNLVFTTGSNQYRQQLEAGEANTLLTTFYGPEWDDCFWEYNPSTGIRRTVTSTIFDTEDEAQPYTESNMVEVTFDDWIIKALGKEQCNILASILELVNNSSSQHSTWTKLNFLADQVHSLKQQFLVGNSIYFTTKVVTHARHVLNDIDRFIISKLPLSPETSASNGVNTFVYQGSDIEQLYDLYDRLQTDNRFIDGQRSQPSAFVNGFCGRVTSPVIWCGTNDELWYFITRIISKQTGDPAKFLVKTNRKRHWSIVNQLFINKDGIPFLASLKHNNDPSAKSKLAIDSILAPFS